MATSDITIMGAGIIGLAVAFSCARRGARVSVIDPRGIAGGSSGGLVGALAPHTPENWNAKKQFQFESLMMTEDMFEKAETLSGLPTGYRRSGRIQSIANRRAADLAGARGENAKSLWQGKAVWELREVEQLQGWAPAGSNEIIFDTLSALANPRLACQSLAGAVVALGGRIETSGEIRGPVVWATGLSGLENLSKDLGHEVGNGVKGQAALLKYDAAGKPQIFADGLHIIPHLDGTVAVGSTSERVYGQPSSTDEQLEELIAKARSLVPVLEDAEVLERWAGVRPRTITRAPIMGDSPNRPGHFIANGGFKIGFGMAAKMGEVMADLVLEGRNEIPEAFSVGACLSKAAKPS